MNVRFLARGFALAVVFLGGAAVADPIVVGSSTFGCSTEILTNDPLKLNESPAETPVPASCADLSGTWEGGCHWAVMKCPRVTALGDCITPRPDEVYLDNVWTKADLNGAPTIGTRYRVEVTQEGCKKVTFRAPKESFFGEQYVLDLEKDQRGAGFLRFRRTCKVQTPRPMEWQRTFDMGLVGKQQKLWDSAGRSVQQHSDVSGNDPNYGAWYRNVKKWRAYRTGDGGNTLRLDLAYWTGNKNYDPPGIDFYSPDFGGRICVWKKVGVK